MRQQQFHFQKTNSRSNRTSRCMKLGQTWTLISLDSCCMLQTIKSCHLYLIFLFFLEGIYNNWSGFNLLKLACSSASYPNSNKTLKPMQDLNGWNVEEMKYSHRWVGGGGGKGVNKMERRWNFGNYTCETQQRGAHTFNANSSTTGKTLKFENVCVMIRIQLHTKLPLHQQHTKGNLNY